MDFKSLFPDDFEYDRVMKERVRDQQRSLLAALADLLTKVVRTGSGENYFQFDSRIHPANAANFLREIHRRFPYCVYRKTRTANGDLYYPVLGDSPDDDRVILSEYNMYKITL